ncbi:MAG: hypothetical protein AAGL89_14435 [Pseudomonadota bacterium]
MKQVLAIILMLSGTTASAERVLDRSVDRFWFGLAIGGDAPTDQVAQWDDSALDAGLAALFAKLDRVITDPDIRAMAQDYSLRQLDEGTTHYHQSTKDAYDTLERTDSALEANESLYVLLSMAQRGDPFAYEGIGYYFDSGWAELPTGITDEALDRRAADLDLITALERLIDRWMYDGQPADPDTIEAYLRYGFDMPGKDGNAYLSGAVLDFYVHDHNDRPSDGYALRALKLYSEDNEAHWVEDYRSFMYRNGVDLPQNQSLELTAAIKAVALGNPRLHLTVGYMYMNGYGVPFDPELSRDILVDCWEQTGDAFCLDNLGIVYDREGQAHDNPALSYALYRYAAEIDAEVAADNNQYVRELRDYLSFNQIAASDIYLTQIRSGDYSGIPHLEDVRPVDYQALLASREGQ